MTTEQIVLQIIEERTAEALLTNPHDHADAYAYVIGSLGIMLATTAELAMSDRPEDPLHVRDYLLSKLRKSPTPRAAQMVLKES